MLSVHGVGNGDDDGGDMVVGGRKNLTGEDEVDGSPVFISCRVFDEMPKL